MSLLLELPNPLLVAILEYLEAESLAYLDLAVCNRSVRPHLLQAFADCHLSYGSFTGRKDFDRIRWFCRKRVKVCAFIISLDLLYLNPFNDEEDDDENYDNDDDPEDDNHTWPKRFLTLFTHQSQVSIHFPSNIHSINSFPLLLQLPPLKSLHVEIKLNSDANCDALFQIAQHTPITLSVVDSYNGNIIQPYFRNHSFHHFLTRVRVNNIDLVPAIDTELMSSLTNAHFPNLQELCWLTSSSLRSLSVLIRSCSALTKVELSDGACWYVVAQNELPEIETYFFEGHGIIKNILVDLAKHPLEYLSIDGSDGIAIMPLLLLEAFSPSVGQFPRTLHTLVIKSINIDYFDERSIDAWLNNGWENIASLASLKSLTLEDVRISTKQLNSILDRFPAFDLLSLQKLPRIEAQTYHDIFRLRYDKNLLITLRKTYSPSLLIVLPAKDCAFKRNTKSLALDLSHQRVYDSKLGEQSMADFFDMMCSKCKPSDDNPHLSSYYPFMNLFHLSITAMPMQGHHLFTLRAVCPKLLSLELRGISQRNPAELCEELVIAHFPIDWPMLNSVKLLHAITTVSCLDMIAQNPCMREIHLFSSSELDWDVAIENIERKLKRLVKVSIVNRAHSSRSDDENEDSSDEEREEDQQENDEEDDDDEVVEENQNGNDD